MNKDGSAALDDSPERSMQWLFGGDRETTNPHGCPARQAAMAVVAGVMSAVLERQNVRHADGLSMIFGPKRSDAK